MKLTDKQLKVITEIASETAIKAYKDEIMQERKRKHDRRLRNVKLLLKNYRSFVKHTEDIKLDILELEEKLELDDIDTDEFKIESIKRSKEKTLAMINFINKMLAVYKTICEEEGEEAKRRYQVIYDLYIVEEKITVKKVAEGHSLHYRTVYKYVDKACKDLSVLMFGVDGIKFY